MTEEDIIVIRREDRNFEEVPDKTKDSSSTQTWNQEGWSTSGANSPMAGRDQHIYYGVNDRGRETRVKLEREKPSLISTTSTTIFSVLASLATIATSVATVLNIVAGWPVRQTMTSPTDTVRRIVDHLLHQGPLLAVTVAMAALTVASWRYWYDRRRQFPVFHHARSWRRALLPSRARPGRFTRARVLAECVACADDNRPGNFGKLYIRPGDGLGVTRYKCRNGHLETFRGRSLFTE